ncbi:putative protein YqeY [Candidatus Entotheonellaceae bacterium PAL068K]
MASAQLDRILTDIKAAMKAQEKDKVLALRLLHAEIKTLAINERREPTDDDTLSVIARLIKQRQEAIELFTKGGRDDLVAEETFQLEVYRAYQPAQLTEDELVGLVDQAIAATGAVSQQDRGQVMKTLMPQVKGRADGKVVNALVSQKLS